MTINWLVSLHVVMNVEFDTLMSFVKPTSSINSIPVGFEWLNCTQIRTIFCSAYKVVLTMDSQMWTFTETETTLTDKLQVIKKKKLGGLSWSTHVGDDVSGTLCDQGKMPLLKNSSRILRSFGPLKGKIELEKEQNYRIFIPKIHSARYDLFSANKKVRQY